MAQPPSRPRPSLSPIPLQRQNSQSSLQSTTTYHSFAAPIPSPVLARSSLHIETRATASMTKAPSRKTPSPAADRMLRTESPKPSSYGYSRRQTPSPGAEKMMRTDSGYGEGNALPLRTASPVHRTSSPVPRTASPLSYTKDRPSRIPSPVQTQSTFSSRQKERPLPIRTSITESPSSSRNSSVPRRHRKQSSQQEYQPSTPTSPTSPTFSEASQDSTVATSTNRSTSKAPRPRPTRQNKSHTAPSGRRVSRPSSTRRFNSTPVMNTTSQNREVPFQFFQFPALEDEGADSYPSPPGSSGNDRQNALGISGANGQVGRPIPSTVQYWTSPETRRREYEAIDAASRGVRGFCLKMLPDCLVPKEFKVQGFAQREGSNGETGEEMAERGRKASESTAGGSLRKRPGKRGKGDEGSVRRYRIDIEEVDPISPELEREHERARKESGKRKWFSWGRS